MSVTINNVETDLTVTGDEPPAALSHSEIERVARLVMAWIEEEQGRIRRGEEEAAVRNSVSAPDLFD